LASLLEMARLAQFMFSTAQAPYSKVDDKVQTVRVYGQEQRDN